MGIEDDEAERLTRELAELTGESITELVVVSLRERLERQRMLRVTRPLARRLMEIGGCCAEERRLEHRSPEDVVGYGDDGMLD
ncbi:MAG: type II toxin-antitoxin system VapB family antitoxin [Myxococcales bacterium]|nr:type II toxin-antitoxin system VapB family antitoxin [Myxococcales bacterium]